uniref:Vps72/YL1 C-terminal domain-containing protein n=1 Tax=Callorhinchus milii TaxID=7868 RepID=A0A4W3KCC5_CALMI
RISPAARYLINNSLLQYLIHSYFEKLANVFAVSIFIKYSVSLQANYTDPQSKLRFSSTEEFSYIRMLPSDIVTGYLALRKATSIVP